MSDNVSHFLLIVKKVERRADGTTSDLSCSVPLTRCKSQLWGNKQSIYETMIMLAFCTKH